VIGTTFISRAAHQSASARNRRHQSTNNAEFFNSIDQVRPDRGWIPNIIGAVHAVPVRAPDAVLVMWVECQAERMRKPLPTGPPCYGLLALAGDYRPTRTAIGGSEDRATISCPERYDNMIGIRGINGHRTADPRTRCVWRNIRPSAIHVFGDTPSV
jgi:hypothetical protein